MLAPLQDRECPDEKDLIEACAELKEKNTPMGQIAERLYQKHNCANQES